MFLSKYAQIKRFHRDHQLKVYMYDFMCFNPDTMPVEEHFPATIVFVANYKKMSSPGPVPKNRL